MWPFSCIASFLTKLEFLLHWTCQFQIDRVCRACGNQLTLVVVAPVLCQINDFIVLESRSLFAYLQHIQQLDHSLSKHITSNAIQCAIQIAPLSYLYSVNVHIQALTAYVVCVQSKKKSCVSCRYIQLYQIICLNIWDMNSVIVTSIVTMEIRNFDDVNS